MYGHPESKYLIKILLWIYSFKTSIRFKFNSHQAYRLEYLDSYWTDHIVSSLPTSTDTSEKISQHFSEKCNYICHLHNGINYFIWISYIFSTAVTKYCFENWLTMSIPIYYPYCFVFLFLSNNKVYILIVFKFLNEIKVCKEIALNQR